MEKALVLALSAFGACLGIGLAALGAAIGDGHAASKMLEGTARQPEMGGKLLVNMLISIGLIESMSSLSYWSSPIRSSACSNPKILIYSRGGKYIG